MLKDTRSISYSLIAFLLEAPQFIWGVFITETDFLIDGGETASYFYGWKSAKTHTL